MIYMSEIIDKKVCPFKILVYIKKTHDSQNIFFSKKNIELKVFLV